MIIEDLPEIRWEGVAQHLGTESRLQGLAMLMPRMSVPVMLIKHTDLPFHWCGYMQCPEGHIPLQHERVEIESYTRPRPTFYGPSGPIIRWVNVGPGTYVEEESYWIGFDLQAAPEMPMDDIVETLKGFVRSFYEGYVA